MSTSLGPSPPPGRSTCENGVEPGCPFAAPSSRSSPARGARLRAPPHPGSRIRCSEARGKWSSPESRERENRARLLCHRTEEPWILSSLGSPIPRLAASHAASHRWVAQLTSGVPARGELELPAISSQLDFQRALDYARIEAERERCCAVARAGSQESPSCIGFGEVTAWGERGAGPRERRAGATTPH